METESNSIAPSFYCQYLNGNCNEQDGNKYENEAFFIYPSEPAILAKIIYETVKQLQQHSAKLNWLSWENLSIGGQVIFCEICKAIKSSKLIVANITNINFNVLFELGFAIGLRKPVLTVRDTSYSEHNKSIDEIGIFDTIGYESFSNSKELVSKINSKKAYSPVIPISTDIKKQQPIYYIKSHIDTDGSLKLNSCLKKSYFHFRSFDPKETTRLSLHEAYKQVMQSASIVAHLMDSNRNGSVVNNARAAFICGMALAAGKHVLMLQEGINMQPIDYRDIIVSYNDPELIPHIIEKIVRKTADSVQSIERAQIPLPKGLLERIDLGDVAAENEIQSLGNYFVKTPQFQQTRQGHARLVIGRKGSGKTALFYGVRNQLIPQKDYLIIDLKPEGHQFIRFREKILQDLGEGLKLHALTSFWFYLLLLEIINKILEHEVKDAYLNEKTIKRYESLKNLYEKHTDGEGDFSERLMNLINKIIERFPQKSRNEIKNSEITNIIYSNDINELLNTTLSYSDKIQEIWILFDNIDKSFPAHGIENEDIYIIQSLLEATRKIQRSFNSKNIQCTATIFLRRDVYEILVDQTPDRGKEQYVNLDWSDIELIKELLLRRFKYQAPELGNNFKDVWANLFELHVFGEDSFLYIINRTFLRPRDVLNFVRKCIQVAVSRDHERVDEQDIITAEQQFSEDMLNELRYEMRDVLNTKLDLILSFIDCKKYISKDEIELILLDNGIMESDIDKFINLFLWFSFIGIKDAEEEIYSYNYLYNVPKLNAIIKNKYDSNIVYCVHPTFRMSLNIKE
ncbi:MAG: hypothetical protein Q8903_00265 [Bacteroidota bacterium]|nr:hypothetical protein [Bacteroidota bacterium]